MMTWLMGIVAALAGAVGLMAVIGTRLPRSHVASRRATFTAPERRVFDVIAAVGDGASWRKDLKKVEVLPDGAFVEHSRHGKIRMRVVEEAPPRRLVTRIDDPSLPFGGTWTFVVEPAPDGRTQLTITEHGEIGPALFRFMSRYVFGHHKTLVEYLEQLGAHLGERVTVEEAESR